MADHKRTKTEKSGLENDGATFMLPGPSFSTSCIFQPCNLVRHIPVLHLLGLAFSVAPKPTECRNGRILVVDWVFVVVLCEDVNCVSADVAIGKPWGKIQL